MRRKAIRSNEKNFMLYFEWHLTFKMSNIQILLFLTLIWLHQRVVVSEVFRSFWTLGSILRTRILMGRRTVVNDSFNEVWGSKAFYSSLATDRSIFCWGHENYELIRWIQFGFYQPRSGMVIRKVELGLGWGWGHFGPVLFLPAACGMVF